LVWLTAGASIQFLLVDGYSLVWFGLVDGRSLVRLYSFAGGFGLVWFGLVLKYVHKLPTFTVIQWRPFIGEHKKYP
jgi:hypothetical protein